MQDGLQPIHYAAQEGHEAAVVMLIKDFNVNPDAKTKVDLCQWINVGRLCHKANFVAIPIVLYPGPTLRCGTWVQG